jgi:Mrp family chromosome partitioning ATPase
MIDQWLRPVERIVLSGPVAGARVVGVVAPGPGSGVSTFCLAAAEVIARAGHRVLVADLARRFEGSARGDGPLWTGFEADPTGFDVCAAVVTPQAAYRFNNGGWLRDVFMEDFAAYDTVIVDLPPVVQLGKGRINPLAAAGACDAVLLLCAKGASSPDEVANAAEALRSSRARLVGGILNDRQPPRRRRAA